MTNNGLWHCIVVLVFESDLCSVRCGRRFEQHGVSNGSPAHLIPPRSRPLHFTRQPSFDIVPLDFLDFCLHIGKESDLCDSNGALRLWKFQLFILAKLTGHSMNVLQTWLLPTSVYKFSMKPTSAIAVVLLEYRNSSLEELTGHSGLTGHGGLTGHSFTLQPWLLSWFVVHTQLLPTYSVTFAIIIVLLKYKNSNFR